MNAGISEVNIKLLFFARYREVLGISEESIEVEGGSDIAALIDNLCERGGDWIFLDKERSKMICALNQEVAKPKAKLSDGDELAIYPPVTGG